MNMPPDMLAALMASAEGNVNKTPAVDAPPFGTQIEEMDFYGANYALGIPLFNVGDLITPRKRSIAAGRGQPFMVIEVKADAEILWDVGSSEERSSSSFGTRPDIRIIGYSDRGDCYVMHWCESFLYEKWDVDKAQLAIIEQSNDELDKADAAPLTVVPPVTIT